MRRPNRRKQLRKVAPLAGAIVVAAGLLGGAVTLSGLVGGNSALPSATSPSSTTTTTAPPVLVVPVVPGGQSGDPVSPTATFTLTLPKDATAVSRTGDSQAEELRFTFAGLEAVVISQPTPGGMPLAQWVGGYAGDGVKVEPAHFGSRRGFLASQRAGSSTALTAIVGHAGHVFSLQLVGPHGDEGHMRVALARLAASLSPQ